MTIALGAAITPASDGSGTSLATLSTAAYNQAAGELISVTVKWEGTATPPSTVTDTAGNTYTRRTPVISGTAGCVIFDCLDCLGNAANVITVTWPSAVASYILLAPYRATKTAAVTFKAQPTTSLTGTGTAVASGAFDAGDFAVAVVGTVGTGASGTPGSGWTEGAEFGSSVGAQALYRVDSPGGTYNVTCTLSTSSPWIVAAASYVEDTGPKITATPDADISDGAWTPSTGTDLYAAIDESPFNDSDYISVNSNSECEIGLSDPGAPGAGTQQFTYRASGSPTKALVAGIYRGATLVQEWTTDPLTSAITEYVRSLTTAQTDLSDLRIRFKTVDAASPPTAQVNYGAIGTAASGTTSANPSFPTGISAATSKLIAVCTGRSSTADTAFSAPAGWTSLGQFEGGTGTWGVDTGTRRVAFFLKDTTTGTETGTTGNFSFAAGDANSTMRVSIIRVEIPAGFSLSAAFASGADTTNGTGFSATASSTLSFAPNDLLMLAVAQNIDTGTQSAQSITAAGITFGTRTNRASTAVTNGNDHRHIIDTVPVSSGTATVAPTYAYTISAAGSGPVGFLRLRAVAPTEFARVTFAKFTAPDSSGGGPTGNVLKSYNGSVFQSGVLKAWSGSAWVAGTLKRNNGSGFV